MNRDGQVSSGSVRAGRLSGIIFTRFFLVGMGVVGWEIVSDPGAYFALEGVDVRLSTR